MVIYDFCMSRAALETEQATTYGTDPVQGWELVCPYRWCTLNGVLFGIRVRFHETIYQNLNGMCWKQEHDYCSITQKSLSFIHIEFLLKRFITKSVRLAVRSHCSASVLQQCVQSATEADNSTFIVLLWYRRAYIAGVSGTARLLRTCKSRRCVQKYLMVCAWAFLYENSSYYATVGNL